MSYIDIIYIGSFPLQSFEKFLFYCHTNYRMYEEKKFELGK